MRSAAGVFSRMKTWARIMARTNFTISARFCDSARSEAKYPPFPVLPMTGCWM